MPTLNGLRLRFKKLLGIKSVPSHDAHLTRRERVFRAPPLSDELAAAIKLISPHCDFSAGSERHRDIWERDQNASCWGEYEALQPFLESLGNLRDILEIGPGMGRSIVFLSRKLGWENPGISAYEGNGSKTRYTFQGERGEDSFCGNIRCLEQVLRYNGIETTRIYDASAVRLCDITERFDLIYSFYCIGYHWALRHFMPEISILLRDGGHAVFTVTDDFNDFEALDGFTYKFVSGKTAWPPGGHSRFLILHKAFHQREETN